MMIRRNSPNENPAGKDGHWTAHPALKNVGNESPMWGDVNADKVSDVMVGNKKGTFVFLSQPGDSE